MCLLSVENVIYFERALICCSFADFLPKCPQFNGTRERSAFDRSKAVSNRVSIRISPQLMSPLFARRQSHRL